MRSHDQILERIRKRWNGMGWVGWEGTGWGDQEVRGQIGQSKIRGARMRISAASHRAAARAFEALDMPGESNNSCTSTRTVVLVLYT